MGLFTLYGFSSMVFVISVKLGKNSSIQYDIYFHTILHCTFHSCLYIFKNELLVFCLCVLFV